MYHVVILDLIVFILHISNKLLSFVTFTIADDTFFNDAEISVIGI